MKKLLALLLPIMLLPLCACADTSDSIQADDFSTDAIEIQYDYLLKADE